eukprot:852915_1
MFCDVTGIVERMVINTLLHLLCTIAVIWFIYQYATTPRDKTSRHKGFDYMSYVFFGFILIIFISYVFASTFVCINPEMYQIPWMFGRIGLVIQYVLLIYMLFYRLCIIFNGTPMAVSRCTVWTFNALYLTFIICSLILLLGESPGSTSTEQGANTNLPVLLFKLTYVIQVLLTVLLIGWLVGLFIRKMVQIQNTQTDPQIMKIVTKTFILTIASIATFLLMLCAITLDRNSDDSVHLRFIVMIVLDADTMTNFLGIILGFSAFDDKYMALCGSCHRGCTKCCTKIVSGDGTTLERDMHQERTRSGIDSKSSVDIVSD